MKPLHYVLNDRDEPIPCRSLKRWAKWLELSGPTRRVAHDQLGDAWVSTIFIGLDHSFGDGPPLLFETTIFGGKHNHYQRRYSTRADALRGHFRAVAMLRREAKKKA